MALSVEITRLLSLFPRGVFLQWDLLGATEAGAYSFDIYRSGSPEGPWTLLLGSGINIYSYSDVFPTAATTGNPGTGDINQLSLSRNVFYRVVVTPPSGTDNQIETVSEVEPRLSGRQRLLKRKILRDERICLQKLNGVEIAVVKRMHWGPRCPRCWDKYSKEAVRTNCSTCFGTGFTPGYFTPIVTLGRRSTSPDSKQVTPQGAAEFSPMQVTLLDLPKVEPDDILVFLRDNRRFIVKVVIQTELQTVTVHQKLEISELARDNMVYRIVVDAARIPPLF